jgi:1,5-anhydro-D-fructose reductase (1,5-anhydro-D-mannitol-forming)
VAATSLRFGLIGSSGHASRVAAPTLRRSPDAVLLGVVGSRPERSADFAARHELPRSYGTLDDMLGDPDIDAVWVCSPNGMHAADIARCAAAGKHVLSEKPLATTSADAAAAVGAARRAGVTLKVAYQHRFRPAHLRLVDLVRRGTVGDVGVLRIHRFWRFPYYEDQDVSGPPAWRRSLAESGGWVINDLGSHLIDLMLSLTGFEASVIDAALATQHFTVETEDTAVLLLALPRQGIGIIETSGASASPGSRVEVYGSAGWIRADDTFTGAGTLSSSSGDASVFAALDTYEAYAAMVADFAGAVRGHDSQGATGEEGAANVAIVEAACARPVRRRTGQGSA